MLSSRSKSSEGSRDERFDGLLHMVRRQFGVVAVLLTTGAQDLQRFCAGAGPIARDTLPDLHMPLPSNANAHTLLLVPDISRDEHLRNHQLTKTFPALRFLAVCPLQAPDGGQLGLLYLLHDQPRELDSEQQKGLQEFAQLAAGALLLKESDRAEFELPSESERRKTLAIATSGTGVWDRNMLTGKVNYSDSWKALLGYTNNEIGDDVAEAYTRIHPADFAYVLAVYQEAIDGRTEIFEVEHRLRCRDGSYKWVCSRGKVVEYDGAGNAVRMVGATTDVTAMYALSEQIQLNAALLTDLTNEIPGMVFQSLRHVNGQYSFSFVSIGVCDIYGVKPEQLMQDADMLHMIIHPDDLAAYLGSLEASARDLKPWSLEYRVLLPGGGAAWRQGAARPRALADGSVLWHGIITDVTERKLIEAELQVLASTDSLTQLSNRRHFMQHLESELARVQRSASYPAVILMFDLDHFKAINDRWGHSVGDLALQHFSAILCTQLRRTDAAGRMGGEEFAVVLSNACVDEAKIFAQRVQDELAITPLGHGDECLTLAVSVGIASLHSTDVSAEASLSRSDKALYRAKRAGRNRIECY